MLTGWQIENMQQEGVWLTMERDEPYIASWSANVYVCNFLLHRLFRSDRISDLWPSSIAGFHGWFFRQLATVKILLAELAVGGTTWTKTKTNS